MAHSEVIVGFFDRVVGFVGRTRQAVMEAKRFVIMGEFSQWAHKNLNYDATPLPMQDDERADKANMVIYGNLAEAAGVFVAEDGATPYVYGTNANVADFDQALGKVVSEGRLFTTFKVEFEFGDDMPEADAVATVKTLFAQEPKVDVSWDGTNAAVYGLQIDAAAALAKVQAVINPPVDVFNCDA